MKISVRITSAILSFVLTCSSFPAIVSADDISAEGINTLEANDDFVITDNVLVAYNGEDTHTVIPDGVTTIGHAAFEGTAVFDVTVPASVTAIESSAFSFCDGLTNINLPVIFRSGKSGREYFSHAET